MKQLACICFTDGGKALAEATLPGLTGWQAQLSLGYGPDKINYRQWASEAFSQTDALLFIGAAGIAVRAIAPLLQDKTRDPAVLVMDETGRFVIPILSGHIGGANRLAKNLAAICGGQAALTTATDVRGLPALDEWATQNGFAIANPERVKPLAARLLQGETLSLFSVFPLEMPLPSGLVLGGVSSADILISPFAGEAKTALHLIPPCVAMGIGCRKGIEEATITAAAEAALQTANVVKSAVCGVYSIDLKAQEPGLLAFSKTQGWPLTTYPAAKLQGIKGCQSPSPFVKNVTGVDNVCERSALAEGGRLILTKTTLGGVTIALALREKSYSF